MRYFKLVHSRVNEYLGLSAVKAEEVVIFVKLSGVFL
jgi:hypothetical protein